MKIYFRKTYMVINTHHGDANYNVIELLEEEMLKLCSFAFKSEFIHCTFDTAFWNWCFLCEVTSRSNLAMDFVQKLAITKDKFFM